MRYIGEDQIALAVSVDDFKSARHIHDEDVEDDGPFAIYLRAAQDVVAVATGRPFVPGDYEFTFPLWPAWRRWWFPCCPVTEILSVEVFNSQGEWIDHTGDDIRLIQGPDEPQLLVPEGWSAFGDGGETVRVQATCGAVKPPEGLKEAIILLAQEWFDAGIAAEETVEAPRLTMGALRLIKQQRYMRPSVTKPC